MWGNKKLGDDGFKFWNFPNGNMMVFFWIEVSGVITLEMGTDE